jgi:hypothetical protein
MNGTYTKKVKAVPTTNLGEILKVKLSDSKTEYTVIWVGGPGMIPSQVIIHRPIGKTKLGDEEWVASDASDVAHLLSRTVNPRGKEIMEKRNANLRDLAVDAKLISVDAAGVVTYPNGVDRNTFLKTPRADAQKLVKEANKLHSTWKVTNRAERSNLPPKKLNLNEEFLKILKGMKEISAKEEIAYSDFITGKANKEIVEKRFPDNFCSMKGPYADTLQEGLEWAKGMTLVEMKDTATKWTAILTGRTPTKALMKAVTGKMKII